MNQDNQNYWDEYDDLISRGNELHDQIRFEKRCTFWNVDAICKDQRSMRQIIIRLEELDGRFE